MGTGLAAALVLSSMSPERSDPLAQAPGSAMLPDDSAVAPTDFFAQSGTRPSGPPTARPSRDTSADQVAGVEVEASAQPESPESDGDEGSNGGGGSGSGGNSGGGGGNSGGGSGGGGGGGNSGGDTPRGGDTGSMNTLSSQVFDIVNSERSNAGCSAVRVDNRLVSAAQLHSEDMDRHDYMSHTGRNGSSPGDRASAQGYDSWSGENVAKGQRSAEQVMDAWMNSPGHRANILNCDNKALGVGEANGAWTQLFGRE
ncbi:hypothetical protein Nans01_07060 [Nocardiopsis ansamitocini]|uniref:SCP domain-containing protein n=1 Tax=Nocardiopsis ansamitocini TaxID=1670832 RepID=A0A9W6UHU1_9ACTN|nr:hypothetical protein Nans01_07060 [Nocardiopsis ansamitocini]